MIIIFLYEVSVATAIPCLRLGVQRLCVPAGPFYVHRSRRLTNSAVLSQLSSSADAWVASSTLERRRSSAMPTLSTKTKRAGGKDGYRVTTTPQPRKLPAALITGR